MNNLSITQEDFAIEAQRLLGELKSEDHSNKRVGSVSVTTPLESFFRIYFCCVGLAARRAGAGRGDLLWEAHDFLADLEQEIHMALKEKLKVDNAVSVLMEGFQPVLHILSTQLPPRGDITIDVEAEEVKPSPVLIDVDDTTPTPPCPESEFKKTDGNA